MNTTIVIFAVALVLAVIGIVFSMILARKRMERLNTHTGSEYDSALQSMGKEKKSQREESWMNGKDV